MYKTEGFPLLLCPFALFRKMHQITRLKEIIQMYSCLSPTTDGQGFYMFSICLFFKFCIIAKLLVNFSDFWKSKLQQHLFLLIQHNSIFLLHRGNRSHRFLKFFAQHWQMSFILVQITVKNVFYYSFKLYLS